MSKQRNAPTLLFPGESSWVEATQVRGQDWEPLVNTSAPSADEALIDGDLPPNKSVTYWALPVRHCFLSPIWIPSQEEADVDKQQLLQLQLEKKGLVSPENNSSAFAWRMVKKEAQRELNSVVSLPARRELGRYPLPNSAIPQNVIPSLELLPFTPNQVFFWKELNHWTVAITAGLAPHNDKGPAPVVYAQDLQVSELTPRVLADLEVVLLLLESENVCSCGKEACLWSLSSEADKLALHNSGWVISSKPLNKRELHPNPIKLDVPEIVSRKRAKSRSKSQQKLLLALIALVIVGLAGWLGYLGWLGWKTNEISTRLASVEPQARAIEATARQWQSLEYAVIPSLSPLESLLRCTQLLQEKEIRLTKFEQMESSILIQGETVNPTRVYGYVEELKQNPRLKHCQWKDPDTKILPQGKSRFVLEGTISHAPTE
ncbi:MAG: hypothetical protein AAF558_08190 [Verrucomicrobiota bacterium]